MRVNVVKRVQTLRGNNQARKFSEPSVLATGSLWESTPHSIPRAHIRKQPGATSTTQV